MSRIGGLADHKTNEPITDREHEVPTAVLTLLRDKTQWVPDFLDSLKNHAKDLAGGKPVNHQFLMGDVIQARFNEPTNTKSLPGVLMAIGEKGGYDAAMGAIN